MTLMIAQEVFAIDGGVNEESSREIIWNTTCFDEGGNRLI